jgi:hypothetical protein
MKIRQIVIPTLLVFAMTQCSKSGSGGRPQISLKSVNSVIPVGGSMQADISFTQSNGQLSQGLFIAIRTRLNQIPLPPGTEGADTLLSQIPEFPDKNQGTFLYTLDYSYLHESDVENDTFNFKFAVVDRAGNKSDTISSGKVVVLKP